MTRRRCNHHSDCDRVDRKHPGIGHCHDPDCESPTAENCAWVQSGATHEIVSPGPYQGEFGSSTPPIACWSCGRSFSLGFVGKNGEPVAYHALPLCAAFNAANTVAEMARFSEKCRLAQNPTLS